MLAVPIRTARPMAVMAREVPGLLPLKAASTAPDPVPTRALVVPGRAKPVNGRPDAVMGRIAASGIPVFLLVAGRDKDVPGRGACAIALSSKSTSPIPSSSQSLSSM
jgi:hypothetical protein